MLVNQFYCILRLDDLKTQLAGEPELIKHFCDPENLEAMKMTFVRYAIEETLRREQKDSDISGQGSILGMLFEGHEQFSQGILAARKDEIEASYKITESGEDFAKYDQEVERVKRWLGYAEPIEGETHSQVVDDQVAQQQSSLIFSEVAKVVKSEPWNQGQKAQEIEVLISKLHLEKMVSHYGQLVGGSISGVNDVIGFRDCKDKAELNEFILAIVLQNSHHVKNADRSKAVTAGTWRDLRSLQDAKKYLAYLLYRHLVANLKKAEKELVEEHRATH